MFRRIAILVTTLALAVSLTPPLAAAAQGVMLAPGDHAPDIRGRDKNNDLQIVDFGKARFTLLNFWATWCQPCKKEMPALQALHERYGPDELQIVGVTSEYLSAEEIAEFTDQLGLTFTVFRIGDSRRAAWPGVSGTLPNSFLIGEDGRIVRRYVGASPAQIEGLEKDIGDLIAGRPLGNIVLPSADGIAVGAPDKAGK